MYTNIKLITFDAMNTLFTIKSPPGLIYLSAAKALFPSVVSRVANNRKTINVEVQNEFRKVFSNEYKDYTRHGQAEDTSKIFWHKVISTTLFNSGVDLVDNEMKMVTSTLYRDFGTVKYWEVFPEVPCVLQTLKSKNVKLGIASNFDERLEKVLVDLDLERYFDFIISPPITGGVGKPDAQFFEKVLEIGESDGSQTVHIGDDIDLDYIAAVKCGINPLLLDKSETSTDLSRNYKTIASFDEIFKLVELN